MFRDLPERCSYKTFNLFGDVGSKCISDSIIETIHELARCYQLFLKPGYCFFSPPSETLVLLLLYTTLTLLITLNWNCELLQLVSDVHCLIRDFLYNRLVSALGADY
jgi:hypothetical protein